MKLLRIVVAVAFIIICVNFADVLNRTNASGDPPSPTALTTLVAQSDGSGNENTKEQKLLIISDNQEHLLTGGKLKSMSSLADKWIASVAVRSPLANVGGRLLMAEALQFGRQEGAELVLHLGDAADISCPDELTSTFDVLDKEAPNMWFMAPGNHDGLLAGNFSKYQPSLNYDLNLHPNIYEKPPIKGAKGKSTSWIGGCLSPTGFQKNPRQGDILTRGDAIQLYIDRIKTRPGAVVKKSEDVSITIDRGRKPGINVPCKLEEIDIESSGYTAIARICRRTPVSPKKTKWVGPYASFIIQKLKVGEHTVVLADTSNYLNPSLKNVALGGEISSNQRTLIENSFNSIPRENLIIAGHHPLDALTKDNQEWIIKKAARYISGHVHRSTQLIDHKNNNLQTQELNIGSILDYPSQAVIAKINRSSLLFRVSGADVSKTQWAGFLSQCTGNEKEWKLEDQRIYTNYRKDSYVKHLLEALREAAKRHDEKIPDSRLSLKIPAGDQPGDWLLLDEALQSIRTTEGASRSFWACQAFYASEATKKELTPPEKIVKKFSFIAKKGRDATGEWLPF